MTIDALVVGGGPVGLAMGCELSRHGLRCRVVETKTEREPWSKASIIQPRTLEVLRQMGVVDAILEAGNPIHGVRVVSDSKPLTHIEFDLQGTPFPYMLGLSQKRTEEILEAHFESLGGALERGVSLDGFEQSDTEVRARLSTGEEVVAPWLLACDGAHSSVRKALDLSFEGSTFEQELIHADLKATLPGPDHHEGLVCISEHGSLGFLPLFGAGRYRLIVLGPETELREPTLENFREHVNRRAPGMGIELSDPEWMIGFRFHSRLVPSYRSGRVFLAGDAAHIHSPAGAQGMNLGLQDAFNLAWKIALVSRGASPASLLESYSAERRPIGERIVTTTDAATRRAMRMMRLRNPIATALRDQLIRFITSLDFLATRAAAGFGGLNVAYPESPIVGQHHSSIWKATVAGEPTEAPSLREWIRFERGPAPGERVPDVDMPDGSTLFDLLAEPRHQLLLFDGAVQSESGYETLRAVAAEVGDNHGEDVAVRVLVSAPDKLDWDGPVIVDPELEVHAHFGARSESLYLIRPDGYVGYRSQPIDLDRLREYLDAIFLRR